MAVSIKMAVFCVVVPCRLVEVYQHFKGLYCPHHQSHETAVRKEYVRDKRTSQSRHSLSRTHGEGGQD
jgi:hypothetical protein